MKCIAMACFAVVLLGMPYCLAQQATGSKAAEARKTPAQIAGVVQQAIALERQSRYTEAQAAWESVVQAEPRNALAYSHLGLLEARQEHYSEAIAYYRKAKALDSAIPQLNLDLGLALFKSGKFQESAQIFQTELNRHPGDRAGNQRLIILAGMSRYGARQYGAAIPYLKDAASVDPRNLALLLTLGHCYLWTRQLDAALDAYKQILLINPDSAEADMIAGEALDEKGDKAGAVQQFRAAVLANPKEPNVHFGLAYLLWTQKNFDEAISEFNAELQNDPKNYQAMIYLGDVYVQTGAFDKARELLEKAAPYEQRVSLLHLNLGIVYQETGNADRAVREFNEAIKLEPDSVSAHFKLGTLYRSMGKKDEAKVEFTKASSLNKKTDEGLLKRIAEASARPEPGTKGDAAKPDAGEAKPEKQ